MKKSFKIFTAAICLILCALCLFACNNGKRTVLGLAPNAETLDYSVRFQQNFKDIVSSAESFAARFAASAYAERSNNENIVLSPISVYMSLALASECANGQTKEEILNALGISQELLRFDFKNLYNALSSEYKRENTVVSETVLSNSIWLNKGASVNNDCIDTLANSFYCNSFSADFANDNKNANKAVRKFVKDSTKGLIDKDFALSADTMFALINSLYLKDVWSILDDELPFANGQYDFENISGDVKKVQLLQGYYNSGSAVKTETFSTFYTATYGGYKIKFILPNDGYGIDEVFNAQNIAYVNGISDYNSLDDDNTQYVTRCLFPEFSADYDNDVKQILQSDFGINNLFDIDNCDFSALTSTDVYCSKVQHVATLNVNKKGVEGAAVTVSAMDCTSAGPSQHTTVYLDFVVNKAFGFILTDKYDCTLFSGVVHKV